jgi:hypothetical protein
MSQSVPAHPLEPREPFVPARLQPQVARVRRIAVLVLAAMYIIFFTWMFWWRFVTYDDYLLSTANCPPETRAIVVTDSRKIPQPRTTNEIIVTSKRAECVRPPDPSNVRP